MVDGGSAKAPFRKPALAAGVVLVGRLRKDAALRDVPSPLRPGPRRGPGRPRTDGAQRLRLAKRAGQKRGWQTVAALRYGERVPKSITTFLAPWPPVGGVRRVVLVHAEDGWLPCFGTDVHAPAAEVLETVAARSSMEQDFHDLKEGEGLGQQQVRNSWANVAVDHLNLWAHPLVELWAWGKRTRQVCARQASPWEETARRPSQADKRKALQRPSLEAACSRTGQGPRLTRKLQRLLHGLIRLVS